MCVCVCVCGVVKDNEGKSVAERNREKKKDRLFKLLRYL